MSVQVAHSSSVCHIQLLPHSSASITIILIWKPSPDWSQMPNKVCGTSVQVLPNGVVVHGSCCGHKQVPDGMGEWDDAITLEEHNSQAVNQAPTGELLKAISVILSTEAGRGERSDVTLMWQGKSYLLSLSLKLVFLHSKKHSVNSTLYP